MSARSQDGGYGPRGKGQGRNPSTYAHGESDGPIVPTKPTNKTELTPAAETVEERGPTKENTAGKTSPGHSADMSLQNALDRVRKAARKDSKTQFTALLHHVTLERLEQAYRGIKPGAAPGIDGVTWAEYGQELEQNLSDLHARLNRGAYKARPTRRAYIPKTDGGQRPLGIAALEDKIVQRAVVEVLNAIYEVDFLGFSYGFRPRRSAHDALDALTVGIKRKRVNWVLDADIRGFFDAIDHEWLMQFVKYRIADRRVLRLIQKWLKAGVIEDGTKTESKEGTPQGASVSTLLANIYLHYAFDLWANRWRRRHANGEMIIVRYADDFVVGFQHKSDAQQFLKELRQRLAEFSLELADNKTRLIEFGRFAAQNREKRGDGKPETFDFLGFTHICAKTREGRFKLKRVTSKKKMTAKLSKLKADLMQRRHLPVPVQGSWLASVVRGHGNYFAVPDNSLAVDAFRTQATRHWRKALKRRSQRSRLSWDRMSRLDKTWLPKTQILHPWPDKRFDAKIRGRSPVRSTRTLGSVRGAT